MDSEVLSNKEHEKRVADFFATVGVPTEMAQRYPVLTHHQMAHRLRREIPVGDGQTVTEWAQRTQRILVR